MQLRQRLESSPETLLDFVKAADERYWEGAELASRKRHGAGIYLMGYAAEMYLKFAALRFDGASLGSLVYPQLLPVRRWMQVQHPTLAREGFHSLIFWLQYLRSRRKMRGIPLDKNLDGLLVHHVQRIYFTWWVEMRYRPNQANEMDIQRFLKDAAWLRDNYADIWS